MHNEYLTWHPKLVDLINQTSTKDPLEHRLVSVNTELELDGIHEASLRPLIFQFHKGGDTTVHKLTPFDSTYEEPQPYCIVYDEFDEDLVNLQLNDDELQGIEFNADFQIGPNGGLMFRKSGHYICAIQPTSYVLRPKGRTTGDHEPIVDIDKWYFGRRYETVVIIEVV